MQERERTPVDKFSWWLITGIKPNSEPNPSSFHNRLDHESQIFGYGDLLALADSSGSITLDQTADFVFYGLTADGNFHQVNGPALSVQTHDTVVLTLRDEQVYLWPHSQINCKSKRVTEWCLINNQSPTFISWERNVNCTATDANGNPNPFLESTPGECLDLRTRQVLLASINWAYEVKLSFLICINRYYFAAADENGYGYILERPTEKSSFTRYNER